MAAARPVTSLAAALAAVSVHACLPGTSLTSPVARNAGEQVAGIVSNNAGIVSNNAAGLVGNNSGGLVGNNSGGLVANNSAGFSGSVRGPAALIESAPPRLDPGVGAFLVPGQPGPAFDPGVGVFLDPGVGAFYRTQRLEETPLGGALIYLSRPDESLYLREGKVVGTTSDPAGRYDLGRNVLPEGKHVVVNALFAGNRRLVGFGVSASGSNLIDLDVASTYTLELLRNEARRDGRTFADYDLARLPDLVARARSAVEDGSLGVELEKLVVGRQRTLAGDYASVLATRPADLAAWGAFLGRPVHPLVTVAGTFGYGLDAAGPAPAREAPTYGAVAVAVASGSLYVASRYSHQIGAIDPAGVLRPVSAVSPTDPTTAAVPPVPESGAIAADVLIPSPIALAADGEGNLFVTMNSGVGAPRNVILMICAAPGTKFGVQDPVAGRIYRIAGGLAAKADLSGFDGPAGMAVDGGGNLFVADRQNDRVVRVLRSDGSIELVAGRGPASRVLTDEETSAAAASLFMPAAVAWRHTATGEELFVVDAFYQRIRAVRRASGSSWPAARVATLAGSGRAAESAGAPVVAGAFAGDGGPAPLARLGLAQVDTISWFGSELPVGGLAVDAARDFLYFSDGRNRRVRRIDLGKGTISTVAGGGDNPRNGIAADCRLELPAGLALEASGDLLIADLGAHAIRRLVLPY